MEDLNNKAVDIKAINKILNKHQPKTKLSLKVCARCSLCAESCFLYVTKGKEPEYMPSYKIINTIGKLQKKKGKVKRQELEHMGKLLWDNCVLCTRCYCPVGIDIPSLISAGRSICRSQGVFREYNEQG